MSDGIDPSRVGVGVDPNDLKNTDPNFPGCCFRFCCPPCAVYAYEGECTVNVLIGWCLGCWFTMFCWNPRVRQTAGPTTVVIQNQGGYDPNQPQVVQQSQVVQGYDPNQPQGVQHYGAAPQGTPPPQAQPM